MLFQTLSSLKDFCGVLLFAVHRWRWRWTPRIARGPSAPCAATSCTSAAARPRCTPATCTPWSSPPSSASASGSPSTPTCWTRRSGSLLDRFLSTPDCDAFCAQPVLDAVKSWGWLVFRSILGSSKLGSVQNSFEFWFPLFIRQEQFWL